MVNRIIFASVDLFTISSKILLERRKKQPRLIGKSGRRHPKIHKSRNKRKITN